jgi:hypothetical protein
VCQVYRTPYVLPSFLKTYKNLNMHVMKQISVINTDYLWQYVMM